MRGRIGTGLVALLTLAVVAGCGLKPANSGVLEAEPGSIKHYDDLEGVNVTVGSKEFTEQLVFGNMIATIMTAAGAQVTNRSGTTGSSNVRRALIDGTFEITPEYTGTGWITYLGHDKPITESAEAQWKAVDEEDRENGLVWLPPAPMNNTYALAMGPDANEKLGITKLSELQSLPPEDLTFCVDTEFLSRDDGLKPMLEHYGLKFADVDATTLGIGQIYQATAQGDCNFGEVFTTDGRIEALDLTVLEDDKKFFPLYNMTEVVNADLLEDHPEIKEIFAQVNPKLTDDVLRELNAKVDVDGEDPAEVARDWLVEEGFVKMPD
ncbi:glycine betaine ABC transporter substrate-binding protein [Solicola gregarius]|uniref:Glycine betaine ABC transporter substrate-binding protein n=1 Tax=Solicola gregarius TaxID=2908642 RepID=A0AA46YJY1_9ACTN|nr:glycine betaine ABC transporter substrate-binding protein [Solicola gregarius]UYM04842.1 glycine betaine ABC transporter substrate-binding protein [Solicola gregarius]